MQFYRALGVCIVFSVAGCSGPKAPLNPPQLVQASETDMSLQLFMQATIMLAKYYGYNTIAYAEFRERAARAGFSTLPFMPPVTLRAVPPLRETKANGTGEFTIDIESTESFRARVEQRGSIGHKGLIAYYIRTGLRASQLICRNYLLGLDENNQYLEFLKKEFGVAYTLADGILTAVSANTTLLHSVALTRDATLGGVNAYEEYRFLAVDRETARSLVEVAQEKYAAYFTSRLNKASSLRGVAGSLPEFFTFSDALNAVSTIEYQCTREGIRTLIARAVNNTPSNLDVDEKTGTIMFNSNLRQEGTSGNSPPAPAPGPKPNTRGPEAPANTAPKTGDGSVKPPVVPQNETVPG